MKNYNKKAQIAEAVLLVAAIAVCTYSLYAIYTFEKKTSEDISIPINLLEIYSEQDLSGIYAEEAGKLSVHEAFAKLSKRIECPLTEMNNEIISIWDSGCLNDIKINEGFSKDINDSLSKLSSVPFNVVAGKEIAFNSEEIKKEFSDKDYSGNYSYQLKFSVENPLESFLGLYSEIVSVRDKCLSNLDKTKMLLETCVEQDFISKDWKIKCSKSSSNVYLLCVLTTKTPYFYADSFKPVEIKIAFKSNLPQ